MDNLPEAWEKYVEAAAQAVFDGFVGGTNDPTLLDLSASIADGHARAAILAFLNAAEKDGWGMKPRKPTPEMIEAADHVLWYPVSQRYSVDVDAIADAYCAMFDAAKDEGP